jgi:predicted ATPase
MVQRLSGLPTEELERALADLVQTGLVIARGRGAAATYNFKFALLQSAIYMSLLHSRRRAIHARLADLLEENESGRTPAKQLAWDFAQSGAADGS